jgi:hypothetical protein
VNVEASASNVGTSALEVLEKSPGISVDKDGNISLKGKQGVQGLYCMVVLLIYQVLIWQTICVALAAIKLDQIEIMTNPPAKYDAAGNSGIINISKPKRPSS